MYDSFKFFDENREADPNKVKHLVKSIDLSNKLHINPIIVDTSMRVLDGQHRLKAAEALGVTVYYVIDEDAKPRDLITLQTQFAWTMKDYLRYWIKKGKKHYGMLNSFVESYGLSLSVSMYLLSKPGINARSTLKFGHKSLVKDFKDGNYKVGSYAKASEFAGKLFEVKEYCQGSIWRTRCFISALQTVYENAKHKHLKHKLDVWGKKIKKQVNKTEYLRLFEDILNYRASKKKIVRLY